MTKKGMVDWWYRTAVHAFSPAAGRIAPRLRVYIQIYFQAGMLQMKPRSLKFA